MGALQIKWEKRAQTRFDDIAAWYTCNLGQKAALNFVSGIYDTLETLSYSPRIGTVDQRRSTVKTTYYTFLSHPKYRIIYRFTKTTLYVVTIHATLMEYN
jgi:plasmid stabilization system protein ParE